MRYFQPKEYQYVSQYTPDMMELDYKKGQDLLKQEETFDNTLNDAKKNFTLSKGLYGTQRLVDEANNAVNTNLSNITTEYNSGKISAREATNKLLNLTNTFNNDESIKALKADKALLEAEKAAVASNKLNRDKSLNSYGAPAWSTRKDRLGEIDDINELKTKLPGLANTMDPGNALEVAQKAFKGVVHESGTSISNEGTNFNLHYEKDSKGNDILIATDSSGTKLHEGVSVDRLKQYVQNLVDVNKDTNPDQYWEWHRRNGSTKEEIINELMGNYPGDWEKTVTQSKIDNKIVDASSSKGKKGSEDNPNNLPQETVTVSNNGRDIIIGGKTLNAANAASTTTAILNNKDNITKNVAKKATEIQTTMKEKDGSSPVVSVDTNNENILTYTGKDPLIYAQVQEFNANTAQSMIKQTEAELIAQSALDVVHDVYPNFNPLDIEGEAKANELLEKSLLPYLNSLDHVVNEGWGLNLGSPSIKQSKVYKTIDDIDIAKEDIKTRLKTIDYILDNELEAGYSIDGYNLSLQKDKLVLKNALSKIDDAFKSKNNILEKTNPGYNLYSTTLKKQLEGSQYRGERMMIVTDEAKEGEGKYIKSIVTNAFSDRAKRSKDVISANTNDDLEDFWEKYDSDEKVKEAVDKAIQNKTYVRGDVADNEWVLHLNVGEEEGFDKPYQIEIKSPEGSNQSLLMGYAESHGYDADYFRVMTENNYGQTLKASNGVYGILNSYAPNQSGLNLYTRTVTTPRTVDGVKLEEGETVFTLPERPDYLFRVNSDRSKLFLFHNDMDDAITKGNVDKQNKILANLPSYGIEPIYNPKLAKQYSRDVRLNIPAVKAKTKQNSPEFKAAQEEVNKWEAIINRKQKTGKSGSVLTDQELQQKLAEAKQNLENVKLGK
jgi:hypothetical protein